MELKKRKRQEVEAEVEDESPKKKSLGRREARDKVIMERYHESQKKQGILKKNNKKADDEDKKDGAEGEPEMTEAEVQDQANEMMDEFDKIKQDQMKIFMKT